MYEANESQKTRSNYPHFSKRIQLKTIKGDKNDFVFQ